MEAIVEAIMTNVMTEGGHKEGKRVNLVKLGEFAKVLSLEDEVTVLGDVGTMEIVMILHRSIVTIVYLDHELQELFAINLGS